MLWFAVWTALAVGALVVLFLVGRSTYRKGKQLLTDLGRASEVLEELSTKVEDLRTALEDVESVKQRARAEGRTAEDPFGRMTALQERQLLSGRRAERRERHLERDAATVDRWKAILHEAADRPR